MDGMDSCKWDDVTKIKNVNTSTKYIPIALVSSLLALRIENLNFALTSLLLQASNSRYSDK